MPELKEPSKFLRKELILAVAAVAAGLFFTVEHLRMRTNLKSSTRITQNLREELEALRRENQIYLDQQKLELSKVESLSVELNSLKEDKTLSAGKQEELKKLVTEAENALDAQNRKIGELEAKLKNAEIEMQRQKKASATLEKQTKSAKANPGMTKEYVKLVEGEWMTAMERTQTLETDLNKTLSELSGYNKERSKLRMDTATMHYNLAVMMTEQRNFKAAILEYTKVLEIRPDDADAHYNLAILYDDVLNNNDMALKHYRQYIRVAPDAPESNKVRQWIKDKEFDTTFKLKV